MIPNRIFINGFSCYAAEPTNPSRIRGEEVEFIRADKVMEILKGRQLVLLKTNQTYWVYEELIKAIEAL